VEQNLVLGSFEMIEVKEKKEAINHPSHYNRSEAMECIDEMILVFGLEAVKNFCLCNSWKYRYRAADKNGEEDLKKSDWYIKKYKELCDNERKYYYIKDDDPDWETSQNKIKELYGHN